MHVINGMDEYGGWILFTDTGFITFPLNLFLRVMAISVVGETAGSQSTHLLRHLREIKRPFRSSLFNPHLHRSTSPFLIIALVLTRSCTLAYSTWDFPRWLRGCLLLCEIQCNPKCSIGSKKLILASCVWTKGLQINNYMAKKHIYPLIVINWPCILMK